MCIYVQLIRSGVDTATIGLSGSSAEAGGLLHSIRELLFKIVQDEKMPVLSTEAQWFYHAVKQEAAAVIYHGFSVLFPSLLDRLQVMNQLLNDQKTGCESQPTAKKLLVPMLVPCFASPKMLFQLMNDTPRLFSNGEVSTSTTSTVSAFMWTLMESLWHKSSGIIKEALVDESTPLTLWLQELEALEKSDEFKCLNVILRAALFWCSGETEHGWKIVEAACSKLVEYLLKLLTNPSTTSPNKRGGILLLVQHSLPGRLLPFLLLSTFSLPAVRESTSVLLDNFWPTLEHLITRIHLTLTEVAESKAVPLLSRDDQPPSVSRIPEADRSLDDAKVTVTNELRTSLSLEAGDTLTYGVVCARIWRCMTQALSYESWKVKDLPGGFELRRVTIPAELGKLFGTDTLVIKFQRESPETDAVPDYDSMTVCFKPSLTVLSQHISPVVSSGIEPKNSEISSPGALQFSETTNFPGTRSIGGVSMDNCKIWLQDLQNILVWVGSAYSAALFVGDELPSGLDVDARWRSSPLFKGGLEEDSSDNKSERNNALVQQIIDNVGAGKKLLDRVRSALDPGSRPMNGNPQLRATRLKRQDSVEATLEKSGGFEAVDRAVRITFAVLLKHSNVSYVSEPLTKDGSPSDTVIDAWRAALTLRRW
jgi:hypothetical protein